MPFRRNSVVPRGRQLRDLVARVHRLAERIEAQGPPLSAEVSLPSSEATQAAPSERRASPQVQPQAVEEAKPTELGVFRARAKLGADSSEGLVVHCGDRRFHQSIDEFIAQHLRLEHFDRLVVPGGVFLLAFAESLPRNFRVGRKILDFLVPRLRIPRVVLIAHQDCQRYRTALDLASLLGRKTLEQQEIDDLHKVRRLLLEWFPKAQVETYFAAPDTGGVVSFREV